MGAWGLAHLKMTTRLTTLAELSELPGDELATDWAPRWYFRRGLPGDARDLRRHRSSGLIAAAKGAAFDDLGEEVVELAQSESVQGDTRLAGPALAALGRLNGEASEWRGWSQNRLRGPDR